MVEYHYIGGCNIDPRFVRFVKRYKPGDIITVEHPDMIAAVKEFILCIDTSKSEIPVMYTKGIQIGMVVKHPDLPGIWDVETIDGDYVQIQPSYNGVPVSTTIKRVLKSELTIWRR